ncbi:hypothetical protein F5X68DRAFT_257338 [Plectosphaerella plurivora]|uniref:Uncharacterized protein n=1 Tax=Plectosphaerella plurivora TaxID=936078 RepID=A0A9P8VNA8_9PEZI|nr:hypothetical protein F5X68DRAFT_257338 [Plectosphaerella plurivora]
MESSPEASRSGEEEDAPKAIYTTAGTLYKPKTAQPMQAPNRRGRTKWNLSGVPSSGELSLLPKSALATLQMRGMLIKDNGPVPEYSPLQQNTDRAVSPSRRKDHPDDVDKIIESQAELPPHQRTYNHLSFVKPIIFNGSNKKRMTTAKPVPGSASAPAAVPASTPKVTAPTAPTPPATVQAAEDNKEKEEAHLSDSDTEHPLRGMGVQSLKSLASYENPHQKRAQKALMGGRTIDNNDSAPRPNAPDRNWPRPKMTGDGTVFAPGGVIVPPEAYPTGTIPHPLTSRPIPVKSSAYYQNISRYTPEEAFNNTPTGPQEIGGGYKTTLAQGPGAPKPLTAGPPGLRQHKTSQMEGRRSIQDNNRSQMSTSDESPGLPSFDGLKADRPQTTGRPDHQAERGANGMGTTRWSRPLPPRFTTVRPTTEPVLSETSEHLKELRHGTVTEPKVRLIPRNVHSGVHAQDTVYDNKQEAAIMRYYPDGPPAMIEVIDTDPNWLNRDHAQVRPPWNPGTFSINKAEMERRSQQSLRQFYAGYDQMGGSMDDTIRETERRTSKRNLGYIGDRRPKPPPIPKITIEQANAMPTSEAAKPILNMAFKTIMRTLEETENQEAALKREQKQAEEKAQAQAQSDRNSLGAASSKGKSKDAIGKSSTT